MTTASTSAAPILTACAGGVRTLTLNRPDRRNALSPELIEALLAALAEARDDPETRVVVLTGAGGKAFCAGGDLGSQLGGGGFVATHEGRGRFADLVEALLALGKPTIARVDGACMGGGLGLMLACDLAIASTTATFGTPEIKVGLFPMMIMTLIFRNMGRKAAMEMMLTGDKLSAAEARELGLLNRVVEPAELDQAVAELAGKVAAYSPAVLKLGRDAVYATMDMPLKDALRYLHSQLSLNTLLEDCAIGVKAFLTRTKPVWRGR